MNNHNTGTKNIAMLLVVMMLIGAGCAAGSFTTREKGAGISMGQEQQNYRQQDQIQRNQSEIDRQRQETELLRRQRGEY